VTLVCAHATSRLRATITYISPSPRRNRRGRRSELHYRVEARPVPQQAALLKPGQSITVNL